MCCPLGLGGWRKLAEQILHERNSAINRRGEIMAKEKEERSVFDVAKIREFIELMREHDLSEVDLKQSDQRIRLRRGAADIPVTGYAMPPAAQAPVPAVAAAPA